jgi:threonyl-tRNA synthetase
MEESLLHPLAPMNQTAAVLLASAVSDLFPDALLIGGQGTPDHFFYDFVFPFTFQKEFLTLIEERMRFTIREKRGIKKLDMMPSNAAAMMRHRGQKLAADALLDVRRAVIEMCQIGDFVAYSPQPFSLDLSIPFFKLLEGFPLEGSGGQTTRIVGIASRDKQTVKSAIKQLSFSSRSHLTAAIDAELFAPLSEEGFWMWRSKGLTLFNLLDSWWRAEHVKQNFSLVRTPVALMEEGITQAHLECYLLTGASKIAEVALLANPDAGDLSLGLFAPRAGFADQAHLFCPEEKLLEETISSLQFILKIPKILGFEFEIVLSVSSAGTNKSRARAVSIFRDALEKSALGYSVEKDERVGTLASVDIRFPDALGRRWTGPQLSIPDLAMPVGKGSALIRSTWGSFERIAALILEKREKQSLSLDELLDRLKREIGSGNSELTN